MKHLKIRWISLTILRRIHDVIVPTIVKNHANRGGGEPSDRWVSENWRFSTPRQIKLFLIFCNWKENKWRDENKSVSIEWRHSDFCFVVRSIARFFIVEFHSNEKTIMKDIESWRFQFQSLLGKSSESMTECNDRDHIARSNQSDGSISFVHATPSNSASSDWLSPLQSTNDWLSAWTFFLLFLEPHRTKVDGLWTSNFLEKKIIKE